MPIATLIASINPLIMRAPVPNTAFTADETAPVMPEAIAVPTDEKIDLISFQMPLKKPVIVLNAF